MLTNTETIISQLDNYLDEHDHYSVLDNDPEVNNSVSEIWGERIISAIKMDFSKLFSNIDITTDEAEFNIVSDDDRGACVFYCKAVLKDIDCSENLQVAIKSIVNHSKTVVYLSSRYANTDAWPGNSALLRRLFKILKKADNKPGYFSPVPWSQLFV